MRKKYTLKATLEVYESEKGDEGEIIPCAGCDSSITPEEPCWIIGVWTDETEPAQIGTFCLHKDCVDFEPEE